MVFQVATGCKPLAAAWLFAGEGLVVFVPVYVGLETALFEKLLVTVFVGASKLRLFVTLKIKVRKMFRSEKFIKPDQNQARIGDNGLHVLCFCAFSSSKDGCRSCHTGTCK
jgi:hypothetical protein